jgi:hypothetical protein
MPVPNPFARWRGLMPFFAVACLAGYSRAENLALKLDGQGSYVELPAAGYEDLTQATVEAWVKWDALNNYSRVFEFGSSWKSMAVINNAKTDDLRFNLYPRFAKTDPAARNIIWVTNAIRVSEWMHLAAVSGPGGMQLYLNGRLVGQHTNTTSFAPLAENARFVLGHGLIKNPTDQDFQGEMDEIRIWNYRRSAAQIRGDMFKQLRGNEPGLVRLWNFDDGTANNATTAAAHGQLRGNAAIEPSDLGLVGEKDVPTVAAAASPQSLPPAAPAAESPAADSRWAAWWIAAAVTLLAVVLAWLAFMFRRSGLGSQMIVAAQPALGRQPREAMPERAGASPVPVDLKEQALAELTSFAKESLVQGLFTQRAALLDAQKRAHEELAQLEARLANLDVQDRILAYETRIADLERQVASRGEQVEGLTKATLQLLRKKLAQEKQREHAGQPLSPSNL